MKKILLTFALVLVAQIAIAQDDVSKKDVLKLIELSGSAGAMNVAKDQILKMIPEAKKGEFVKEFDAKLPALYDEIAKIYMETYTKQDIKELLKFYETPIGKKLFEKTGEITSRCMAAGQKWASENMQDLLKKYMQ